MLQEKRTAPKITMYAEKKLYSLGYETVHYSTLLIRDIQKASKLVRSPRRKEIKHVTKTIHIYKFVQAG